MVPHGQLDNPSVTRGRSDGRSGSSRRSADVRALRAAVIETERAGSMNRRGAGSRGCVAALVAAPSVPASTVDPDAPWRAFAAVTDGLPLTRSRVPAPAGPLT